MVLALILQ